jgi:hypothetical protein
MFGKKCRDELNFTPLHYAAAWGYINAVERLMAAGSDPTMENLVS